MCLFFLAALRNFVVLQQNIFALATVQNRHPVQHRRSYTITFRLVLRIRVCVTCARDIGMALCNFSLLFVLHTPQGKRKLLPQRILCSRCGSHIAMCQTRSVCSNALAETTRPSATVFLLLPQIHTHELFCLFCLTEIIITFFFSVEFRSYSVFESILWIRSAMQSAEHTTGRNWVDCKSLFGLFLRFIQFFFLFCSWRLRFVYFGCVTAWSLHPCCSFH